MNTEILFPLYLSDKQDNIKSNKNILAVSLRRKSSDLAKYSYIDGKITKEFDKKYDAKSHSSCTDLIKSFVEEFSFTDFDTIAIAVPGPVIQQKCITRNLPWEVDGEQIKADFGVNNVIIINDLEAISYSLPNIKPETLKILHNSENQANGNMAILAAGKGLGEAGLFWGGTTLRPFATEGGHTEFSPRNDFEIQFYQFLNKIYGIVTWEKVLSERGVYDIYRFLRDIGRHKEEEWLTERLKNEDFIDVLFSVGTEKTSRLVELTIQLYAEFLAREANNLVLKLKAVGGLIITGNLPHKLFNLLDFKEFYHHFIISDKMEYLLKDVPIYWLDTKESILDGIVYYSVSR